ncbi:hypothetical protein HanXRQr2_Chr17g0824351 [Helianthus annuus]|uniref:Tf2-1-like SH3-like domain-containing protein n=1 Tax=Helianthus annuus TaxID=4232 RepID=A0A9K3DL29_HELAN|nr:hypothetical protein HanXRQr2_Chr17g0824351 [Helianthus annuus]
MLWRSLDAMELAYGGGRCGIRTDMSTFGHQSYCGWLYLLKYVVQYDRVLLKVSPWKGVVRFGKRGKLNPRYVEPFEIIEKIGKVAYRLNLPEELSGVHNVFHVSNLKKCLSDETLIVPLKKLTIDDQLRFVEEPVEITEQDVKILKHTRIPLVRVRWNSPRGPEYTWEREDQMKLKYPQLFKKNTTTTETEATTEFRDEIPNQRGDDVTPQGNQENNAT